MLIQMILGSSAEIGIHIWNSWCRTESVMFKTRAQMSYISKLAWKVQMNLKTKQRNCWWSWRHWVANMYIHHDLKIVKQGKSFYFKRWEWEWELRLDWICRRSPAFWQSEILWPRWSELYMKKGEWLLIQRAPSQLWSTKVAASL